MAVVNIDVDVTINIAFQKSVANLNKHKILIPLSISIFWENKWATILTFWQFKCSSVLQTESIGVWLGGAFLEPERSRCSHTSVMTSWCNIISSQVWSAWFWSGIQAECASRWSSKWVMLWNVSLLLWWHVSFLGNQVVDAFLKLHI